VLRNVIFTGCIPLFGITMLADRITAAAGRKHGLSNTYRVLAQRTS
jgi:hypothetical protein